MNGLETADDKGDEALPRCCANLLRTRLIQRLVGEFWWNTVTLALSLAVLGGSLAAQSPAVPASGPESSEPAAPQSQSDQTPAESGQAIEGDDWEVPSDEEILSIVRRLGAGSFQVREAATAELLTIGPRCLPILRRTVEAEGDAETRQRVQIIVQRLAREVFEARVEAFLEGGPNASLPGWDYSKTRLADTPLMRELYVGIVRKHPTFAEMLDVSIASRSEALGLLTRDLDAGRRQLQFEPNTEDCIALLMLAGDPQIPTTGATDTAIVYLLRRFEITNSFSDPEVSGVLRKLVGQWMPRVNPVRSLDALLIGMQLQFEEVTELAEKVLRDQKAEVEAVEFALKALARFGTPADAVTVKPFLDDKRPAGGQLFLPNRNGLPLVVQVRDLAMATVAVLNDRPLRAIGFPQGRENPSYAYDEETLGFPEGEEGERARQRVLDEVQALIEQAEGTSTPSDQESDPLGEPADEPDETSRP